jgi:hypothetical protein
MDELEMKTIQHRQHWSKAIAWHEAGHVVANWYCGRECTSARVFKDSGRVIYSSSATSSALDDGFGKAVTAAAGHHSVYLFFCRECAWRGLERDNDDFESGRAGLSSDYVYKFSRRLISENRSTVSRVARHLLALGSLNRPQLERLRPARLKV